jgi:Regulator of chromosome condensation (RCC1) repeat/Chaperone of endosialidase
MKPSRHTLKFGPLCATLLLLAFARVAALAQVAVPPTISYQGRLTAGGTNFSGSGQFKFALVNSNTNTPVTYWSNDGASTAGSEPAAFVFVPVQAGGLLNVFLGDTNLPNMQPIPSSVFLQSDVSLRIWFTPGGSGFTQLTPDQRLGSVGYAMASAQALSVAGSNVTGTVSLAQLPGSLVTNNQAGVNLSGSFSGNAGGLTNISVDSLVVSRSNSFVSAWGNNGNGQTTLPAGLSNIVGLAAGAFHSLALRSDGTIVGWGSDGYHESESPAGLSNVIAVSAGDSHSLALKGNGTVVGWGYGGYGQTNVPAGLNNVIAISVGGSFDLALKSDRTVAAWGQGGDATNVPAGLSGVAAVSAGYSHSVALLTNGTVIVWGYNDEGETNIPTGLSNVVAISAGDFHTLALKNDGTVVSWGDSSAGATNVPVNLSNVVAIAGLNFASIALKADGTLVAWGYNGYGLVSSTALFDGVTTLEQGCQATHGLVVRRQAVSPVAMLNGDNTFSGRVQFNGMILGKVGINTATPSQALHIYVPPGQGEGMEIDNDAVGYSPAIYLNHTGSAGRNFRIASYGDNFNPGSFVIRDDTAAADRFSIDGSGNVSVGAGTFRAAIGAGQKFSLSGSGTFEVDAPSVPGGRFFIQTNGNIGIGTASPQTQMHLLTSAGLTSLRLQSTATPGFGRLEFLSDPLGSVTEWRPGFIQSTDNGGFTGGLAFYVNGSGSTNRFATNEVMRIVNGRVGIGTNNPTTLLQVGGATCNGSSWANASDRALKENFEPVNAQAMLAQVAALPISCWNYKNQPGERHVGPMAQDFHAAFGTGEDDKHIATVDAEGIALAAIKGLNQKLESELKRRDQENEELRRTVQELEAAVQALARRN